MKHITANDIPSPQEILISKSECSLSPVKNSTVQLGVQTPFPVSEQAFNESQEQKSSDPAAGKLELEQDSMPTHPSASKEIESLQTLSQAFPSNFSEISKSEPSEIFASSDPSVTLISPASSETSEPLDIPVSSESSASPSTPNTPEPSKSHTSSSFLSDSPDSSDSIDRSENAVPSNAETSESTSRLHRRKRSADRPPLIDRRPRFNAFESKWMKQPMGSTNTDEAYAQGIAIPESPADFLSSSMKDTLDEEMYDTLYNFLHSLVTESEIQLGFYELNNIRQAKSILHFVSQTIPNKLQVFQHFLEKTMNVEETVDKLEITSRLSTFLHDNIGPDLTYGRMSQAQDMLWECHFRTLIRCTMLSSMDLERFCSVNDISRRQCIIQELGFQPIWKIISIRTNLGKEHIADDTFLFTALVLLLRLTISATNLNTTSEYSQDYYNVGQQGVDGAVLFTTYIESNEDKRRFWRTIDTLLECPSTRVITVLILYNIALFRKSISSLIGNTSLFTWLSNIVLDQSHVPIEAARRAFRRILSIDFKRMDIQQIVIGCPVYIISRGISSCSQEAYDKIFEKLVWNDKFLKRILEYGEGNNLQYSGHIARVLYAVAYRSSLKSKENRNHFSSLLIDNFEGFSSIVTRIVNQDTEIKILSLLQLLSTPGYCDSKYYRIFVNLHKRTVSIIEQRQQELEKQQHAKMHAQELESKNRMGYFSHLKEKSLQLSNELNEVINTVQNNLKEEKVQQASSFQRIRLYTAGLLIPIAVGVVFGLMRRR